MKKYLIIGLLFISGLKINAQTFDYLDINNIRATVNSVRNPLFTSPDNDDPGFEVPKGSGIHSIFSTSLFMGGLNENDSIHLAIQMFQDTYSKDFIPGPIMDSLQYAMNTPSWNRVWKINKSEIDYHINNYSQTGYIIPQVFLDWPAHGDTSLGQSQNLAPFQDFDMNGIYNPTNGDYPLVPGDQCVYFIFNDDTVHTSSNGKKLKFEIHTFVYSFDCDSDSSLNNTAFVKYKMINRSENTYHDFYLGIWSDIDVGRANDDFVGCNIEKGAYYYYNSDNFDEDYSGYFGYNDQLASQSVVLLAGPYATDDNIDNPITTNIQNAIDSLGIPYASLGLMYGDGIIDNERLGLTNFIFYNMNVQPLNPPYYYGILKSEYNNQSITYDTTEVECNYMFPGDSDPLFWNTNGIPVSPWSEITSGHVGADMRTLGSSGPFTFTPNAIHELDLAFVFARDYINLNDNISPITIMDERIDSIRNYYLKNQTPCGTPFLTPLSVNELKFETKTFVVYPNPTSGVLNIQIENSISQFEIILSDITGKVILRKENCTSIDVSNFSDGIYFLTIPQLNSTEKIQILR